MSVSDVAIESSLHGRERRVQRDISKRDLQAAVKFGTRTRGRPRHNGEKTWLYEFADITYVTDATSTKEITAWAREISIEKVFISDRERDQVDEACRRIKEDKSIITSHYVLVVDMSASMRNSDMNGHRNRFRCVYYALAEIFVLDALGRSSAFSGTDVVTLIEMHTDATIVFQHEPISLVLYNRFIELALRSEAAAFSHGNFLPSLKRAVAIHLDHLSPICAPSVFFLTDGKPSDPTTDKTGAYRGVQPTEKVEHFSRILCSKMRPLFKHLGEKLSFTACSFGNNNSEFELLKDLVAAAKEYDVKATFINGSVAELSTSLLSMVSSSTETRTMLSRLSSSAIGAVDTERVRNFAKRMQAGESAVDTYDGENWRLYNNDGPTTSEHIQNPKEGLLNVERYTIEKKRVELSDSRSKYEVTVYKKLPLLSEASTGIAVHRSFFGEGTERVVFLMHEMAAGKPIGTPLVAKESKWALRGKKGEKVHISFAETQMKAASLARKFNERLDRKGIDKSCVPRITFLDCSIYYCNRGEEEFLVERRLNPKNYVKWNDNIGGIDGRARVVFFKESPPEVATNLDIIEEGDEEEDDSDESDDEAPIRKATLENEKLQRRVMDGDVPQAFTHWTHFHTKRDKMVCDLQGELVVDGGIPMFLMTDPAVHTKYRHRGCDKTNRGEEGMNNFFLSHRCNPLCEILGLKPREKR